MFALNQLLERQRNLSPLTVVSNGGFFISITVIEFTYKYIDFFNFFHLGQIAISRVIRKRRQA